MRSTCALFRPTLLVALVSVGITGCGGPKTYPVQGKVVFSDGNIKELAGGSVFLQSASDPNLEAVGVIEDEGDFYPGIFVNGKGYGGVPAGEYRIRVEPPTSEDEGQERPPVIDARFSSFDTSGLTCTITKGNNELRVDVHKPQGSSPSGRNVCSVGAPSPDQTAPSSNNLILCKKP